MHFPNKFHIKVDKEKRKVKLSVKINEETVIITECSVQEFEVLVAQYKDQLEG